MVSPLPTSTTWTFAFSLHCQQVFFSNDPTRPGWKVVCRTDVRGRRGQVQTNQCLPHIIDVGHDADFLGLQPQMEDVEPTREPATDGGIHIPASLDVHREEENEGTQWSGYDPEHLQQRHITHGMHCIRLCQKGCLAGEEPAVKPDVCAGVRINVLCDQPNGWP